MRNFYKHRFYITHLVTASDFYHQAVMLKKQIMLNYILVIYPKFYNSFLCRHLLVQIQQGKHRNNVWNMFRVNDENTRTTSLPLFWCLYFDFEWISYINQEFVLILWTIKYWLGKSRLCLIIYSLFTPNFLIFLFDRSLTQQ